MGETKRGIKEVHKMLVGKRASGWRGWYGPGHMPGP